MTAHKTDYSRISRYKSEFDKKKGIKKRDIEITDKYILKVEKLAAYEKENGIDEWCSQTIKGKSNYLRDVNRFLHNTDIMPRERICWKYQAKNKEVRGYMRNNDKVRIKANTDRGCHTIYEVYINDKLLLETLRQYEVIERIKSKYKIF